MAGEELPPLISLIQANITDFLARMDEVDAKIAKLTDSVYAVKVGLLGDDEVKGKLDVLDARLDAYGQKNVTAKVNVDTNDAQQGLGMLLSTILALGPAASGALTVVAGSVAALPGIFSGLITGAGAAYAGIHGLVPALQAYSAANTNTGQSAATAAKQMLALNTAMSQLSPAAQQFVKVYENELKPVLSTLSKADSQFLFAGLNKAVTDLLPVLSQFVPYMLQAAQGIGQFADQIAKVLGSTQGLRNLNAIWAEGNQFMSRLGDAAGTFLQALLNLGAQGAPIIAQMGQAANNVADAFLRWTQDGGSQRFIAEVVALAPQLGDALASIWRLFITLASALNGLAGPELQVITFISNLLAELIQVNPQLAAFVLTGIGVVSLLSKLAGVATAIRAVAVAFGLIAPAAASAEAGVVLASSGMVIPLGEVALAAVAAYAAFKLVTDFAPKVADALAGNRPSMSDNLKAYQESRLRGQPAGAKGPVGFSYPAGQGPAGPSGALNAPPDPFAAEAAKIQAQINALLKGGAGGAGAAPYAAGVAGSGAATAAATAATKAFNALNTELTAAHTKGLSELNRLLTATHSGNLATLNAGLTNAHIGQLNRMVGVLNDTHRSEMSKLSTATTAAQREQLTKDLAVNKETATKIESAIKDAQAQQVSLVKAAQQAQVTAAAQYWATQAQLAQQTAQIADTAITTAANAVLALAQSAAQIAADHSTAMLDAANASGTAIANAAQLAIDRAATAGLAGAALEAANSKVALDEVQISTAATVAAAQATYDAAKSATDAANAQAQSAFAAAQAAAAQDIASGNLTLAIAQATGNAYFIAQAQISQAQEQSLAAQTIADATRDLDITLAASSGTLSDAAAALAAAQAGQITQMAQANAAYAQAQAAAQAAAAAAAAQAAATSGAAATASSVPIVVQATVITQIDGQTLALTTTPLIRQQLLRSTARQTGNIYGGQAGTQGPT